MTQPSILILDDDELWLARHERRLIQAGFKCYSTQLAKEAIDIGKSDSSVKFALIDEILYVPPIPIDENKRELQRWQGSGVIREITRLRSDIQYIIVTSAPQLWSEGDSRLFSRETARLRRQRGVVDVIHKQDIEHNPEQEYQWLMQLLSQPVSSVECPSIMPRVLIGLGFTRPEYEAMLEQLERKKSNYLPLSAFEKQGNLRRILKEFRQRAKEKNVFVEAPGSKKLDRTQIKSNTQSFQILEILAQKSELSEDVVISQQEYEYSPRHREDDIDPEIEQLPIQDFAYEYSEGSKHLRSGIQIEKRESKAPSSPLKVEINRLKEKLALVNVGPTKTLFIAEQGSYRPKFKLGIVLYQIKTTKHNC